MGNSEEYRPSLWQQFMMLFCRHEYSPTVEDDHGWRYRHCPKCDKLETLKRPRPVIYRIETTVTLVPPSKS